MLTRLKVSGFKSLLNVDIRFGPFTCVAGANGSGKSNLFDAIGFLSAVADPKKDLLEAASSVRNDEGGGVDIHSLFHHDGNRYTKLMKFEAEMIVPQTGIDELGRQAQASITFLSYALHLRYRPLNESPERGAGLEIVREELSYIKRSEAARHLWFKHSAKNWRDSVVVGTRRTTPFISTSTKTSGERTGRESLASLAPFTGRQPATQVIINRHQEGVSGRPLEYLAATLPRTVLSTSNAAESPTAFLARKEMQSWHLLQLEPTALRRSDDFVAPTHLSVNGAHLAATLHRLEQQSNTGQACAQVSNRLAELITGVGDVRVDVDQRREQFTVQLSDKSGHFHSARALSDGTLRFLALAVLELDPDTTGVWCLEEPENGIHPARIPVILRLLQDITMDVDEAEGSDNPMRQMIINTHSPSVVADVPVDTLLIAQTRERMKDRDGYRYTSFTAIQDTWRSKPRGADSDDDAPMRAVSMGRLLDYLNPFALRHGTTNSNGPTRRQRLIDRQDMQMLLPGVPSGDSPPGHR